jgi:hypothetical protein
MLLEILRRRLSMTPWEENSPTGHINNDMKKYLLLLLVGAIMALPNILFLNAESGQNPEQLEKELLNKKIEQGLNYLAKIQNDNGSWSCTVGYKLNERYLGPVYDNVGITAIAGIAFLAHGDSPGRGQYGSNIEKALQFVLSCCRETDGYITKNGTRMYEHGFATLFLSEVYGMSKREDIKSKLKGSVQLIISSQTSEGGWRYQPAPIDADISVSVTILQALRAARNVGIAVPKEVIDKALNYVKKSQKPNGSFEYQFEKPPTRTSFALTAAGITSLMSAGEYNTPEIKRGLSYVLDPNHWPEQFGKYHYFYGHYYATQAMFQAGGELWKRYFRRIKQEIITAQLPDGYWVDEVGDSYATAMAAIILQIPNDFLPIFQR